MKRPLLTFEPQPEFPSYDISETNAALGLHYLESQPEADLQHEALTQSLLPLHDIANSALTESQLDPGNTKGEYIAFCRGFADLDYMALLLQSRQFTRLQQGSDMQFFYIQHGSLADYELARRRLPWIAEHPNTMELLHRRSEARAETPRQLAARAIGAQIASELLYSAR